MSSAKALVKAEEACVKHALGQRLGEPTYHALA